MRQFPLWLCILVVLPLSQHAKPTGIRTADQQANQPLEPPMQPHGRKIDVEQVKKEDGQTKDPGRWCSRSN